MANGVAADLATNRARRLDINNDLQTLSQVLYLVTVEVSSSDTDLKEFVKLGHAALWRLAESIAILHGGPQQAVRMAKRSVVAIDGEPGSIT